MATLTINIAECVPEFINQDTNIFIYFDSSGSMNATLAPLVAMRDGNLKQTLLPRYNNDETLYNQKVKVISRSDEATLLMLGFSDQGTPNNNVVVLVFQDESSPKYHGSAVPVIRTSSYDSDILTLRNKLSSFQHEYRGVVFQVATFAGNNTNIFKPFLIAVKSNTAPFIDQYGLADMEKINIVCDVAPAISYGTDPTHYINYILAALNETVTFCA